LTTTKAEGDVGLRGDAARIVLRKRVRRYYAPDLVGRLILRLREVEDRFLLGRQDVPERFWLPWELLYLIETAIAFGSTDDSRVRATPHDLVKLVRLARNVSPGVPPPGEDRRTAKILRIGAHQQFWWHEDLLWDKFARLSLILKSGPGAAACAAMFQEATGLSPDIFVKISVATWLSWAIHDKAQGTIRHLDAFDLPPESKDRFLSFVGRTFFGMRTFIRERRRAEYRADWDVLTGSPLRLSPVLLLGGGPLPISKRALGSFIEHGIYDRMKIARGEAFPREFGHAFEAYTSAGLARARCNVLNENAIRAKYGPGKTADFLLQYVSSFLLIEAKGVEGSPYASVRGESAYLSNALDSTIIKSLVQIYETIARMRALGDDRPGFGLVVSYKDLHLGPGERVWDEFVGARVRRHAPHLDHRALLHPERIFYLSLRELDWILAQEAKQPGFVVEFFEDAMVANRDPRTSCALVRQHLGHRGIDFSQPAHLDDEWKAILASLPHLVEAQGAELESSEQP
jgi:hypothetical protein